MTNTRFPKPLRDGLLGSVVVTGVYLLIFGVLAVRGSAPSLESMLIQIGIQAVGYCVAGTFVSWLIRSLSGRGGTKPA